MMTANEIRESFKNFYSSKGHHIVPSAPMVIKDDPTLMFTNAGMNQFKDIILGNRPAKYRRVADSQKCLRVSGKHNDLEEVGHDTYHHTMFEMLGNWSFGDYFKEGAIDFAWEYLVGVLKLDPANLYATVFEGAADEGLERDNEAASIWQKYLPEDHIINGDKHDNFWEMGETGPCGPCSEIHIDIRPEDEKKKISGAEMVNKDHPQVIEIWNLVFMQFNRKADGTLHPLPQKVIDTGMGFERLCMAMQGKTSNYDTDVFQPMIKTIGQYSGLEYGKDEKTDIAMRVIADHIRTIAFSITDGQLPGNAKAGYVIRRILRRAVRYAYTFLAQKEAFLYKLVPTLVSEMGEAYPELKAQQALIVKVIKEEEDSFLRTLATGIKMLEKKMRETSSRGETQLPGTDAFTLYDTFGFPLDLTELILRENSMTVDEAGFNAEMQKQKDRARAAAKAETGDWVVLEEGESKFIGYDNTTSQTQILRYRQVKQKKKTFCQIVLRETPFYAESGGQVGDTGIIRSDEETIKILDTKKENNLTVHIAEKLPQHPEKMFKAEIDTEKRAASAANHSCTHLLDNALRKVLGSHVEQKGSLVTPEGLRFDFSHFQKVTDEELRRVEHIVNEKIRRDIPLEDFRNVPIEEAKKMGAIALFGEKYGDEVRVVKFGESVEFCGGTHVPATGRIGMVRIVSESSVAAGIRRIEAVTGAQVEELINSQQQTLDAVKGFFNNTPDLEGAVSKFIEENDKLKKQVEEFMKEKTQTVKKQLADCAIQRGTVKLISAILPISAAMAKDIVFQLRGELEGSFLIVLGTKENNRPMLTVMMSDDLVKSGLNAGKMIREAAKFIKGGGGGQPHFATAGGKDVDGLNQAVDKIIEISNI